MLFSMAAIQMNIVARAWLAYDISGAALAIGLVAVARGLPAFLIAPFAGVAADRFDKRTLLIATQSALTALAIVTGTLVLLGVIEVWQLMAIGFLQGVTFPFTMPTRTAMMSDLVGEELLPNAIALDSTGRNLNRVVAPAMAGLLIAVSPGITYFVIAIFYALAAWTMLRLPSSRPEDDEHEREGVLSEALVGFRYVREQRTIFGLIVLGAAVVLIGMPYSQFLPVFQRDVLDVGPSALGMMYAAVGVGAISASLFVASIAEQAKLRRILYVSGLVFGATLALFAISSSLIVSLVLLATVGFASQSYLTVNKTLIMLETDRALYGRVMSVYMMAWSFMPFFVLPMGAVVDVVGVQATVIGAGLLLMGTVGTAILRRRQQADETEPKRSPALGSD